MERDLGLNLALAISAVSVIVRANPIITELFSSNLVIFILVAIYSNKISKDKNILVSIATAFFAVILVKVITTPDYRILMESFELLYPGPNSSPNCLKVTKSDLVTAFESESALKSAMVDSGVPMNMELNDVNSPEISTYLANNPAYKDKTPCLLIK
jgi:hypothetical protein